MFIAILTHPPELCFANEQYKEEGNAWMRHMRKLAEKYKVKIHGAYICPNEHTFYFLLESNDLLAITEFLGPPMLNHHSAKISPIVTVEDAFGLPFMEKK